MSGINATLWAVAFFFLGLIELALLRRTLYPALRLRHERAKLTQTQGIEPNRIMMLLGIQSLVILPALGFLLADRLKAMIG